MNEFVAFLADYFSNLHLFHFLRPEWFWLLVPALLLWILKSKVQDNTQWHQVIPPHLSKVLLGQQQQKLKKNGWLIPLLWIIAITALAGPSWQKIEKPVFQIKKASVIVMDMSMSMRATDVKPNRLAKARYKAIDLAKAITDGEIALVAYAGDAFTISPLTPDSRNIIALIPSLSPEIMPEQGSYPLSGLETAVNLLKQAGYMSGDIYWLTDGVEHEDIDGLNAFISQHNYKVNIMSFGTAEGAPIKLTDNSLLKDSYGSIVIPKLNMQQLAQFSNNSAGVFVQSTASDLDVRTLTAAQSKPEQQNNALTEEQEKQKSLTGDDWQEFGPVLILLMLPFVLFAFRKGVVLSVLLVSPLLFNSPKTIAQNASQSPVPSKGNIPQSTEAAETVIAESSWTDFVFNTKDQVATKAYQNGEYAKAQQTFNNKQWQGSSAYKAGDHEAAYNAFKHDESATGWYNQGNALAHGNKLDEAIKAYEKALSLNPDFQQAEDNKNLLEQLKQQQEQQQDQQQNSDQNQQSEDQQGGQDQESQDQHSDQQQQDSQNSEQGDQQESQEQSQQDQQSQNQEKPEPTADPSEQESDSESQSQSEQTEQEQNESEQKSRAQAQQEQEQGEEGTQQSQAAQMTPEQLQEQENQQKLEQLLRKVSDDPSVLLRNKMILESRKRQQQRTAPKGATKSW